jgi:hypothetical protein
MRRAVLAAGAVACLALAAALLLLAADVARWRGALEAGDVRYRAAPAEDGLWRPAERVPFGAARRLIDADDDLLFRDAVRALRLGQLERGFVSDPALALPRAEAQALLRAAAENGDASRRSRAFGLVGVIGFANSIFEARDQAALLREAVALFQGAITIDPENGEAKYNLEQALQRGRALEAAAGSGTPQPEPGGAGSRGAGTGAPGSGY